MAKYKAHILFGLFFTALFLLAMYLMTSFSGNLLTILVAIPLIIVYSILPDIDTGASKIGQIVRIIALVIILLCIIFGLDKLAIAFVLVMIVLEFTKHRGFVHTVLAGVLLSLPIVFLDPWVALFALAGYISHLILDGHFKLY